MSRRGFLASSPAVGDRVEADVGEERGRGAGADAAESGGRERCEVAVPEGAEPDRAEQHEHDELQHGHGGGRAGAFADAAHQQDGGERDHDDGREVDDPAVGRARAERRGQVQAGEAVQQFVDVLAPADRDGRHRDAVLQEQAPADQEGRALAESGVGEGVRRSGDRDGAAQLREGEGGEDAGDRGEDEGDDHGGSGLGDRVGEADEDAGADDGADAEADELEEPHRAPEAVAFEVGAGLGEQAGGGLDAGSGHAGWCSFLVVRCDRRGAPARTGPRSWEWVARPASEGMIPRPAGHRTEVFTPRWPPGSP